MKLQVVVKASNAYPKDPEAPPCGVDDMTKLAYLHEPGVLDNLRSRYDINEIYVSILKLNPFSLYLPSGLLMGREQSGYVIYLHAVYLYDLC